MPNFLVFAGTSEGRQIVEWLSGCGAQVCACVATDYGKSLLPKNVQVFAERMDADQMTAMLQTFRFDCVIDATHPYAVLATENIRAACAASDTRYLRLLRPIGMTSDCVYVENIQKAADVISATTGKVLLTTGSKDLDVFTKIPNYQERLFPRVLPTEESIHRCMELGYPVKNIIAMQGPFSREMNGAMMRQIGASVLVTKESGVIGGFSEKLGAVQDTEAIAIVVGRPKEESGLLLDELIEILTCDFELEPKQQKTKRFAYFPMFIDLSDCKIGLFGGSMAAASIASDLLGFCGSLTVVTPQAVPELEALPLIFTRRPYMHGDCKEFDYVFAVTENREVNHAIFEECHAAGIPIYVADCSQESSFQFPLIMCKESMVIGILTSEKNKRTRTMIQDIRAKLDQFLPEPEKENSD